MVNSWFKRLGARIASEISTPTGPRSPFYIYQVGLVTFVLGVAAERLVAVMPDLTLYSLLVAFLFWFFPTSIIKIEYFKARGTIRRIITAIFKCLALLCFILAIYVYVITPEHWDRFATHGTLLPADEPTPELPSACASIPDNHLKVFIGNSLFSSSDFPLPVILFEDTETNVKSEAPIIIDREDDQLLLTAIVRNEKGDRIAHIDKNTVRPIQGITRLVEWPDAHSVRVEDGPGKIVLEIRYINSSSVSISGQFRSVGFPTVTVEKNGIITIQKNRNIFRYNQSCKVGVYGLRINQHGFDRM
jgi:hypothetical protein